MEGEHKLWKIFERCYAVWPTLPSHVLNVYLWGSRVYGLATPSSDWDFFVVVKEVPPSAVSKDSKEGTTETGDASEGLVGGFTVEGGYGNFGVRPLGVPKESIGMFDKTFFVIDDGVCNAKFVPLSHFKAMILEHQHEALECVFLPPQYKLKEEYKCEIDLDMDVLRRTIAWESKRRFMCSNHSTAKSLRNAKKEIVHALRYMLFALQVAKEGKIMDYGCANKYYSEIMAETETDWKYYLNKYEVYRKQLSAELAAATNFENFYGRLETKRLALEHLRKKKRFEFGFNLHQRRNASPAIEAKEATPQQSALVKYLCEKGLSTLQGDHSVSIVTHTKHKNLLFIRTNHYHSVVTEVEKECYNGVLVEEEYPFTVISYSLPYVDVYTSTTPPVEDWSSVEISEKIDGTLLTLYHYANEWHIASRFEPNEPSTPMCWKEEYSGASHECALGALFWKVWNAKGYTLPDQYHNMCFMFQLVSRKHRFVNKPIEDDVIFIGARDMVSLREESSIEKFLSESKLNWRPMKRFSFSSYDELLLHVRENLNPFKESGYALSWRIEGKQEREKEGETKNEEREKVRKERVIVLSERYVSIAYGSEFASMGNFNLIGEMDEKQMLEMIKGNKANLFLRFYPEWQDYHSLLESHYNALCVDMQKDYDSLLEESAEGGVGVFCKKAKDHWQGNLLINMRLAHHTSMREYLALLDPKSKLGFYRLYKKFMTDKYAL